MSHAVTKEGPISNFAFFCTADLEKKNPFGVNQHATRSTSHVKSFTSHVK